MVPTKISYYGGSLLGQNEVFMEKKHRNFHIPSSWKKLEPLLGTIGEEQIIFLPKSHAITVLAYETGNQIASLVPLLNDETNNNLKIESIVLTTYGSVALVDAEEALMADDDDDGSNSSESSITSQVLLVGCNDGTIREFDLSAITKKNENGSKCGSFYISGPCCQPRRVYTLKNGCAIRRITTIDNVQGGGILGFCLIETENVKNQSITQSLSRFFLRPGKETEIDLSEEVSHIHQFVFRVGHDLKGRILEGIPFQLFSLRSKGKSEYNIDKDVIVITATSSNFRVYREEIDEDGNQTKKYPMLTLPVDERMSSARLSPNGKDIVFGNWIGQIVTLKNVINAILEHSSKKSDEGKKKSTIMITSGSILEKKVHWHVNAVTSLSFQDAEGIEPLLYSGGAESVLVIWQPSKDRPTETLPRVAKGGICHVVSAGRASMPGVLVYCEDNTLQLFKVHNNQLVWKLQGLAGSINKKTTITDNGMILVSSSSHSAGNLHWFDPRQHRVTEELEIVPFNRISRSSRSTNEKTHLPPPELTHLAFSKDKGQMLTAETIPTENSAVGKKMIHNKKEIGLLSSVKFWVKTTGDEPYSLVAAMTSPHGEKNGISAVALSNDAQSACTVSNDEKTIRVWRQVRNDNKTNCPAWVCQYKVTTPSGFSNFTTPPDGVRFSSDDTTLCIVYGHMITLWDHRDATLLKTLRHFDEKIKRMVFINNDLTRDFILTKSTTKVKLQSPYGGKGGWSFGLPQSKDYSLSQVEAINNGEQIAISVIFPEKGITKVICLDCITGKAGMITEIPAIIHHILPTRSDRQQKPGYGVKQKDLFPRFLTISEDDEIFLVQRSDDDFSIGSEKTTTFGSSGKDQLVPKIHIEKKRNLSDKDLMDNDDEPPTKRAAILSFIDEDVGQVSSELPTLSGNFLRAFISRNISRHEEDD